MTQQSNAISINVRTAQAINLFFSQLSVIKPFIDDPSIQEIMINGPDSVWIESNGRMEKVQVKIDDILVRGALKSLASANNRDISPVLDARASGFRVAAAMSPVAIKGNAICIRKHTRSLRSLAQYCKDGSFDPATSGAALAAHAVMPPPLEEVKRGGEALMDFFRWMVRARKSFIVAGGTGSGKTTFMNSLLSEVQEDDRILTIEDTAELIVNQPNSVSFETAEVRNGQNVETIDVRRLVRLALRFRPDRIIVGEIRGAEAYDLLDAMNTGHQGGFCSLHADDARMALYRIESMVRMHPNASNLPLAALRKQIANTFEYVVFCSRSGGMRRPVEIISVRGVENEDYVTQTIYSVC